MNKEKELMSNRPNQTEGRLRLKIDTALHPERNGLLIKRGVAEGASHEHIIKDSLQAR